MLLRSSVLLHVLPFVVLFAGGATWIGCSGEAADNHDRITQDEDHCVVDSDAGAVVDESDSGDAGGPIAATLNDVSILFPLPANAVDVGHLLPASSCGPRGTLLPSSLSSSAGFSEGGYADLHLVAMRLDPCFASTAPDPHGSGCNPQLRLIFQLVEPTTDGAPSTIPDAAVHVFYSLSRSELLALARALVSLREASGGDASLGPLAPHPLIVNQGLGGPFSLGVQKLISAYAGASNITRVASLTSGLPVILDWSLQAVDVDAGPTPSTSPFVIPTLPAGATSQSLFGSLPEPSPMTGSVDNTSILLLLQGTHGSPDGGEMNALDSLARIENPTLTTIDTIDCASCHQATLLEELVAEPDFGFDDRASSFSFQPDGVSVVAADLTPTFAADALQNNLNNMHAFSYVGQSAGISQRTVNETAAVVEYLNHLPP